LIEEENKNKPKKKNFWFLITTFVIAKMSKLVKLVKLFKLAKPLVMVVSMSISAVAYAFYLGPWFAIGLVGMLFVHEMGHVAAMRMKGYETKAPVFIPFLGAVIFAPPMHKRDDEAFIGIGGPVLGSFGALLVFAAWFLIEDKQSNLAVITLMVSYVGMFLNIFNLIPISPLDGGRITQAIGPWFKYVGVLLLAVFSALFREPVILFIWLLVLSEVTVLPRNLRSLLACGLWLAMVILMALGYSEQPGWVDFMDCCLGLAIVGASFSGELFDATDESSQRPQLRLQHRFGWLLAYIILLITLVAVMSVQVQHLPKATP